MKLDRTRVIGVSMGLAASVLAAATIALATPGTAATTILASRAALADPVQVNDDRIKFQTKDPTDFLVQTITFEPGEHSGWHHHPGIVMVVVHSGEVTTHHEDCTRHEFGPHEVFVESGTTPFMVSNEHATEDAVVYATLVAPAGSPFRVEDDPPPCAS